MLDNRTAALADLGPRDRAALDVRAAQFGVSVEALAVGIIGAYFTLLRDAAAVLPAEPLAVAVSIAHRLDTKRGQS